MLTVAEGLLTDTAACQALLKIYIEINNGHRMAIWDSLENVIDFMLSIQILGFAKITI